MPFLEMSTPKFYISKLWGGDIQILYGALQNPSSTSEADPTPVMFSRRLPRLWLFSGNDLSHSHSPPMCSHFPFFFFFYRMQIDATGTLGTETEMDTQGGNMQERGSYRENQMEGENGRWIFFKNNTKKRKKGIDGVDEERDKREGRESSRGRSLLVLKSETGSEELWE